MNNLIKHSPLSLATSLLTHVTLLEKQTEQMPEGIRPMVEGMISDMTAASEHIQKEMGIRIKVSLDRYVPGAMLPAKIRRSVDTVDLQAAAKAALAADPPSAEAPIIKAKKKVQKTPGYGKVSQYMDVPGGFGTCEYNVWSAIVSPSGQARNAERGLATKRQWLTSFKAFLDDMGYKPVPDAKMVRKDKSKGFTPRNMTWRAKGEDLDGRQRKPKGWSQQA